MLEGRFLPEFFKINARLLTSVNVVQCCKLRRTVHDLNTSYEISITPTKYKNMFLSVCMSVATLIH